MRMNRSDDEIDALNPDRIVFINPVVYCVKTVVVTWLLR